jgi:hypothetical protein
MSTRVGPGGQGSAGEGNRGEPPRETLRPGYGENLEKGRQPGLRRSRLQKMMRKKGERVGTTKGCKSGDTPEVGAGWARVSGPPGSQKVMSWVPLATRAEGKVA